MYKDATMLLTASVARYVGQFAILILLARVLGPNDAGEYSLALAVTAPVFIVASLGMRTVYLTLRTQVQVQHYESLRSLTVGFAIVVSIGASFLFPSNVAIIVAVVACSKAMDSYNDLYGAILQKAHRIRVTVLTSTIVSVVQVVALGISLKMHLNMALALVASTLCYIVALTLFMRPVCMRILQKSQNGERSERSKHPWIEITRVGLPTGISFGLIALLSTMPQYFLGWTSKTADVGRYATLMYLVVAIEIVLNALSQSWIPVGRRLEESNSLSRVRVILVAVKWDVITLPLAVLGILVAHVTFPHVLGSSYVITLDQVLPLGVAIMLTPMVFASSTALAIQNRYRSALIVSVMSALAGIVIGWVLIRPFGVVGALWSFVACLAVRFGGTMPFVRPTGGLDETEREWVPSRNPDAKRWIILGSANGSTNLGDQLMWEEVVVVVRESIGAGAVIVTDGEPKWAPPLNGVVKLPFLHGTLRRGSWIPPAWRTIHIVNSLERFLSWPRRGALAQKKAERAFRCPRPGIQQLWWQNVRDSEGIVISGAGAMCDDFAPHGISSWALIIEWARILGKPVALVGQGIGPINNAHNREVAGKMLVSADLLTVREPGSASLAVALGVLPDKVILTGDWAMASVTSHEDRVAAGLLVESLVGCQPYIAVSFHRRHSTRRSDLRMLSSIFERLVIDADRRGLRTLFVPNMTSSGYSDDRVTARILMDGWPDSIRKKVALQVTPTSPRITRALLSSATGLVSTRYHPMVFAFSEATPCVGVSYDSYYDQKLTGLSELFSIYGNVHRLGSRELEAEDIFLQLSSQNVVPVGLDQLDNVRAPLRNFLARIEEGR